MYLILKKVIQQWPQRNTEVHEHFTNDQLNDLVPELASASFWISNQHNDKVINPYYRNSFYHIWEVASEFSKQGHRLSIDQLFFYLYNLERLQRIFQLGNQLSDELTGLKKMLGTNHPLRLAVSYPAEIVEDSNLAIDSLIAKVFDQLLTGLFRNNGFDDPAMNIENVLREAAERTKLTSEKHKK